MTYLLAALAAAMILSKRLSPRRLSQHGFKRRSPYVGSYLGTKSWKRRDFFELLGHRPRLQACSSGRHHFWFGPSGAHSLQQVITDSQRVGDDGKSRIHGATRTEEASIDNIKIVELMRFAVAIERACLWIISKTNRAVLVRNSGKRNALSKIQIPREQTFVALVPVKVAFRLLLHKRFEFFNQPFVSFFVVRLVL